jgi:hypothetical protein
MEKMKRIFLISITLIALIISAVLWTRGLLLSPLIAPERVAEEKFIRDFRHTNSPEYQQEKVLAESYWLRYPDVKKNEYWGVNGPMGIRGPRDHYLQLGKWEGRILQPVIKPKDMVLEKKMALAYWKRYPDVRNSEVWGEKGVLGFLGPRDHYLYIGRHQGKHWGMSPKKE